MAIGCSAFGCHNHQGSLTRTGQKISFHRFPKEDELKQKWVRNIRRGDWTPSKYARLCSVHFKPNCFRNQKKKTLHSYAVPTIFPNRGNCKRTVLEDSRQFINTENMPTQSTDAAKGYLKRQLARYKMFAARRDRKLKHLQKMHQEATKKIANLESTIKELQSKQEEKQSMDLKSNITVDNKILSRYLEAFQDMEEGPKEPVVIRVRPLTSKVLVIGTHRAKNP